jgi:hypothetical protein
MLPVAADAAEALFRVVDAAYEKRPIALTGNIYPAGFDELMPKTLAAATVDRLLHHADDGRARRPARDSSAGCRGVRGRRSFQQSRRRPRLASTGLPRSRTCRRSVERLAPQRDDPLVSSTEERLEHAALIRDHARRVVETQRTALEQRTTPYRDLTAALRHVQHEYEDRFLVELVQNAYDQHEGAQGGRIEVLLALNEQPHGTLYVANGGEPISERDLEGLIRLGHSSKVVGESIGNKGVGFRSVYRVCERPEFYSRSVAGVASRRFDGFCFSSAMPDHLPELAAGDEGLLASLIEDVHPSFLPVPLEDQPAAVETFAQERSISTVVRLPLKDPDARRLAREKVEALLTDEAPLDLFLGAVEHVVVLVEDPDRGDVVRELTRTTDEVDRFGLQRYEVIELGPNRGHWFVVTRTVPADCIRQAISDSGDQLDPNWADWKRDGEVALAVPLDSDEPLAGRLYTYLPMGEAARSPFAGHATAPFMARLARRELDADVALNEMLLGEIALAAAEAVRRLAGRPEHLGREALVDLLSWTEPVDLLSALKALGADADELPLVPVVGNRPRATLREARTFDPPQGATILRPAELAEGLGLKLVDPELAPMRRQALERLASEAGYALGAGAAEQASWCESLAGQILDGTRTHSWQKFYREVMALATDVHVRLALQGRQLLLGHDGELHRMRKGRTQAGEEAVFSPSRRISDSEDGEPMDLTPPLGLDGTVVLKRLVDDDDLAFDDLLDWLEGHGLVRRFDRTELLRHVAGRARATDADDLRREALRYAVRLLASARLAVTDGLADLEILVPCAGGWRPARTAAFSAAWGLPNAEKLGEVLAAAPPDPEFDALKESLLVAPSVLGVEESECDSWTDVLGRLGVADGLPLIPAAFGREHRGDGFERLPRRPELAAAVRDAWSANIEEEDAAPYLGPRTRYTFEHDVPLLLGLAASGALPPRERRRFAEVVLDGLGRWPDHVLRDRIQKVGGSYLGFWPTPAAAALRHLPWLPVRSRQQDPLTFRSPNETWLSGGDDADHGDPPDFLALVEPRLRGHIALRQDLRRRLRTLGAREWGAPETAGDMLDELLREDVVAETQSSRRRRTALEQAFRAALATRLQAEQDDDVDPPPVNRLLATVGGGVEVLADQRASLVLSPPGPSSSSVLLATARVPVVPAPSATRAVGDLLRASGWTDVRQLADVRMYVVVDGVPLSGAAGTRISERWPWLPPAMGALAGTGRVAFRTVDPGELAARCAETAIVPFRRLHMEIDGVALDPPASPVVPLRDGRSATVLVDADLDAAPDGQLLPEIAATLCEALGVSEYRAELQLALERLARVDGDEIVSEAVARAFEVDVDHLEELATNDPTRRRAAANIALLLQLDGRSDAARQLFDADDVDDEALQANADTLDHGPGLLDVCRSAEGPIDLWRALGLDLDRINAVLGALSPPFQPVDRISAHRGAIAEWLTAERRAALRYELRRAWAPAFHAQETIDGYVVARRLDVEPDPGWASRFWDVPREVVADHVRAVLRQGRPSGVEAVIELPALETCVAAGRSYLTAHWPDLEVLLAAWRSRRGDGTGERREIEDVWRDVNNAGGLDFVVLDDAGAPQVLRYAGLWPSEMQLSVAPAAHDLRDADLAAARAALDHKAAKRERRRRLLQFADGAELPVGRTGFADLAAYAEGVLDEIEVGTEDITLDDVGLHVRPAGTGGGAAGSDRQRERGAPSEAERLSVGLLGEMVARRWLRERHGDGYSDDAWVSSYRAAVGLPEANDDAGYDFKVQFADEVVCYEVKASRSDEPAFDLGPSQVEAADQAWRQEGVRYVVLHVVNVLDLRQCRVRPLANPRDPRYASKYRQGGGLRCTYRPASE